MFEIQLFADTVSSSREGKLVVSFYDSDDRTLTIDNPKSNITAAQINSFVEQMKTDQPVIGDKTGASVVGAQSFKIIEKTETKLDLN